MKRGEIIELIRKHEILPTPQRVEIADIVFSKPQHLSAEEIIERLSGRKISVAKATLYNTLNLFVRKGLLGQRVFDRERLFYDSNTTPHHHFLNVDTGEFHDIPPDAVKAKLRTKLPKNTSQEGIEIIVRIRNA